MSPLKIRRASPEDADLLAGMNHYVHGIHVEHRPDIYKAQPSQEELAAVFKDRLVQESARIFIAELDGQPVGYAGATLHERAGGVFVHGGGSIIFLDQLAIAPQAKRHGVGSGLLNAVREAGRDAGCLRLITEVWDFNHEARSFYEAVGFLPMKHLLEQSL
ncbi:N-acetyltransferase family protein [Microtetraspora malaysiensis]|uniref:GNAT family N-acetyltransferase n=1 Tax=Microtetraspora malaysiensis TaxID=161358 RepID=UPI003D8D6159